MIEVFKTNVKNRLQANRVVTLLKRTYSEARINFDLNDCDKILRVDGIEGSHTKTIVRNLNKLGFKCETLN